MEEFSNERRVAISDGRRSRDHLAIEPRAELSEGPSLLL